MPSEPLRIVKDYIAECERKLRSSATRNRGGLLERLAAAEEIADLLLATPPVTAAYVCTFNHEEVFKRIARWLDDPTPQHVTFAREEAILMFASGAAEQGEVK